MAGGDAVLELSPFGASSLEQAVSPARQSKALDIIKKEDRELFARALESEL